MSSSSKTLVPLKDLQVGDLIYANVVIDKSDMADPKSQSTTAKKIKKGDPVTRICVVLANPGSGSVSVTYLATFAQSTTLPGAFQDKTYWFPVKPATKESIYDPLPPRSNNMAQWAALRKTQYVTEDPVQRIDGDSIKEEDVKKIIAAMKA